MIDNIICFFLVLTNTGMGDINGINMHLLVRHNSTGEVLIDENRLIENISPQGRDTLQFKTLFVPQSLGDYNFTLTYQYPNENTSRTNSKTVTIRAGLGDPTTTTTYRIGTGGAFPTIESAMNALYHRGIAGHVVFELTAERNPRRGDSLIIDA